MISSKQCTNQPWSGIWQAIYKSQWSWNPASSFSSSPPFRPFLSSHVLFHLKSCQMSHEFRYLQFLYKLSAFNTLPSIDKANCLEHCSSIPMYLRKAHGEKDYLLYFPLVQHWKPFFLDSVRHFRLFKLSFFENRKRLLWYFWNVICEYSMVSSGHLSEAYTLYHINILRATCILIIVVSCNIDSSKDLGILQLTWGSLLWSQRFSLFFSWWWYGSQP